MDNKDFVQILFSSVHNFLCKCPENKILKCCDSDVIIITELVMMILVVSPVDGVVLINLSKL